MPKTAPKSSKKSSKQSKNEKMERKKAKKIIQKALFAEAPSEEPPEAPIDQGIKAYTNLPDEVLVRLNHVGNDLIRGFQAKGLDGNVVANYIVAAIKKKQQEMQEEIIENLEKEEEAGNFKEIIVTCGRNKFMYVKYVESEGFKKNIDQRTFDSYPNLKTWLKITKRQNLWTEFKMS
tara:strand:+ start:618 stop:1148 length:531 start_codon:yes stop_codon:yes gene_type:complete